MNPASKNIALIALAALIASAFWAGSAGAQLGEIAGPLNFTIGLGGTATLNMTIFNSGTAPLPYKVIPPFFHTATANTTKPTTVISPLSGTLAPRQSQAISVTVTIPSANNKPGYVWSGILQVLEVPNNTQQGVAIVEGGVAKGINVNAAVPTFNYLEIVIPAVIIIIIAAVAFMWKTGRLQRAPARKAAPVSARGRKAPARRKAGSRARKAPSKKRRTTKRASSSRARRRRR